MWLTRTASSTPRGNTSRHDSRYRPRHRRHDHRVSAGTITDRYAYDAFGAMRSQSGTTANDFRFTGQQDDYNANRGLYDLRARFYDPSLGRFLTRDPLPFVQRYAYAGDNPANFVDPYGLFGLKDLKKAARSVASSIDRSATAVGDVEISVLSQVVNPTDPESVAKLAETVSGTVLEGCAIGAAGADEVAAPIALPVCSAAGLTFAGSLAYQELTAHSAHQRVFIGAGAVGSLLIPGVGGDIFTSTVDALTNPGVAEANRGVDGKE